MDEELSQLKQTEQSINICCYNEQSNLSITIKQFIAIYKKLGVNVKELHNNVSNSMTNVCII